MALIGLTGSGGQENERTQVHASTSAVSALSEFAVPSVDIASPIDPGGLTDEGVIDPDQGELMWFTGFDRVAPGNPGIAVIAGHSFHGKEPDVFAKLDQVDVGDVMETTGEDGTVTVWEVTVVEVISKTDLRSDPRVWGSHTDTPQLAVITCDDELGFRPDGHRTANRVLFAEPATSEST